jgi:hypothetical protein
MFHRRPVYPKLNIINQHMGGPAYINNKPIRELNNLHKCRITYYDMQYGRDETLKPWTSSEQLYQALKFKSRHHVKMINNTSSPMTAWRYGQNSDILLNETDRVNLMYIAIREKVMQNPKVRNALVNTNHNSILFTGSTNFWNHNLQLILESIRSTCLDQIHVPHTSNLLCL